jgi:exodeoxyribonuclease VII small subunit
VDELLMDAQPLSYELSFEEAFERLEAAVAALQDGQLPLERALQYYEEGMKLAQHCNELLQKAELRVQQLGVDELGVPVVQPLELS